MEGEITPETHAPSENVFQEAQQPSTPETAAAPNDAADEASSPRDNIFDQDELAENNDNEDSAEASTSSARRSRLKKRRRSRSEADTEPEPEQEAGEEEPENEEAVASGSGVGGISFDDEDFAQDENEDDEGDVLPEQHDEDEPITVLPSKEDEQDTDYQEKPKKKRGRKKKGEDSEGTPKKKRKSSKKRGKSTANEGDEPNFQSTLDEEDGEEVGSSEQREKTELDEVLEELKSKNRRLTDKQKTELDKHADVEAQEFVNRMLEAAALDRGAYADNKPALAKLKLLPELVACCKKLHLQAKLIKHNILGALYQWLQLLPDGSLPNLNVRTTVLKILKEMPIQGEMKIESQDDFEGISVQHLHCGIGKWVKLFSRHPGETAENRLVASALVERWSRLVFNLTSDYTKLATYEEKSNRRVVSRSEPQRKEPERALNPGDKGFRYRATQPRNEGYDFIKRPGFKDVPYEPAEMKKLSQRGVLMPQPPSEDSPKSRLSKKLSELQRAGGKRTERAAKVGDKC